MNSLDPPRNSVLRWILPALAIAAALFGVFVIVDRLEQDQRAAGQRALQARAETLNASALQQGGALACLDTLAGESTEAACEAKVFASPQSTAAAVVYTAAQLTLLADAQKFDPTFAATFAARRRAIELDRFGIAAHVLSERDGCTAERCAAFAFLTDSGVLKANMKAQAFDQYVSRHADAWNAPAAAPAPAVSQAQPAPAPAKAASVAPPPRRPGPPADPGQIQAAVVGLDPGRQHHEQRAAAAGWRCRGAGGCAQTGGQAGAKCAARERRAGATQTSTGRAVQSQQADPPPAR